MTVGHEKLKTVDGRWGPLTREHGVAIRNDAKPVPRERKQRKWQAVVVGF